MNTMRNDRFAGDKKKGDWFLAKAKKRMVNWMAPRVPSCLETYHLTLFTLLWSIGIVACSFLARENINWLWAVSLFIFLQYISDVLDGAVGRYRDTGLVKWGYYMDHLLDYVFLASIIAGYALVFTGIPWYWFMAFMALGGAFMATMFLSFAATNEFRISVLKIGPTEARLFFVLVNTAIILFGTGWVEVTMPFIAAGLTVALIFVVFRTQKRIWKIDMEQKKGPFCSGRRPFATSIVLDHTGKSASAGGGPWSPPIPHGLRASKAVLGSSAAATPKSSSTCPLQSFSTPSAACPSSHPAGRPTSPLWGYATSGTKT